MADFGFLSDSDNSAIDEIITQAAELSVLEQVAAINCSGFSDSVLPTELESRFRKLKSLPVSSKPTATGKSFNRSKSELTQSVKRPESEVTTESDEESPSKRDPDRKVHSLERKSKDLKGKPNWENDSDEESGIFSASKQSPDGKSSFSRKKSAISKEDSFEQKKPKSKSKTRFVTSPLESCKSWLDSPSPPRKSGCFSWSPISFSKKKSKGDMALSNELDWDQTDEFLSDLNTFSIKKQQKKLKMAMKEQEKVSREAEKIVKWAKQASARMSTHRFEDELSLSDNESTK